jgi:hypothetical protein
MSIAGGCSVGFSLRRRAISASPYGCRDFPLS